MTLVRKSIIAPYTYHTIYTASLLMLNVVFTAIYPVVDNVQLVTGAAILWLLRIRGGACKYLMWGCTLALWPVICEGLPPSLSFFLVGASGPLLSLASRMLFKNKSRSVNVNPSTRVVSVAQVGTDAFHVKIRLRHPMENLRPGQQVTVMGPNEEHVAFTPLVSHHPRPCSEIILPVRDYPIDHPLSEMKVVSRMLCRTEPGRVLAVTGPVGRTYYDRDNASIYDHGRHLPLAEYSVCAIAAEEGIVHVYAICDGMRTAGYPSCVVMYERAPDCSLLRTTLTPATTSADDGLMRLRRVYRSEGTSGPTHLDIRHEIEAAHEHCNRTRTMFVLISGPVEFCNKARMVAIDCGMVWGFV